MATLTENSSCMAFHLDRWKPGAVVKLGRVWAKVRINGKNRMSKVLVTNVRPLDTPATRAERPNPFPDDKWEDELRIKEDCGYLHIVRGPVVYASIPPRYRAEAEIMLKALREAK